VASGEAAECSREGTPKQVADCRSGWYLRPRENPPLLQENGHDIVDSEELEFLMTGPEAPGANEDRHRSGSTKRAVIPLDAKIL
jgi:hypothetical protein